MPDIDAAIIGGPAETCDPFAHYGDRRNLMDGVVLLASLPDHCLPLTIFDPQYRGIMDKLAYGNEGSRQRGRVRLHQMTEATISAMIGEIDRVLTPSGHLFLWVDKFHLCTGIASWLTGTDLEIVDMLTWDKGRIGMGYRTRRRCEHLMILQKRPLRARGIWIDHGIPDVVVEKVPKEILRAHPHAKPEALQARLIRAVTAPGDWVLDPAAGGYGVMRAAHAVDRRFIGADLGWAAPEAGPVRRMAEADRPPP